MTESDSLIEGVVHKGEEARTKFNACRKAFEKKQKGMQADLDKANRTWNETGKNFSWWGSLP